jgi:hypothetical protein
MEGQGRSSESQITDSINNIGLAAQFAAVGRGFTNWRRRKRWQTFDGILLCRTYIREETNTVRDGEVFFAGTLNKGFDHN